MVDDNATAREVLSGMLAKFDMIGTAVASGAEALSELANSQATDDPYQVVLMDWRMPEMDGIQTVQAIRQQPNIADVEIVLVTAYDSTELYEEGRSVAIDNYIIKPINASALLDTLVNIFGQRRDVAQTITAQLPEAVAYDFSGMHILLVEDNYINQQIAGSLLEKVGARVTIADNGRKAVDKVISQGDSDRL